MSLNKPFTQVLIVLLMLILSQCLLAKESIKLQTGARLYLKRCALCHGVDGSGDGILPLMIDDYPATLLSHKINRNSFTEIKDAIEMGVVTEGTNTYMPPWKDELSVVEIEALTQLIIALRKAPDEARQLLIAGVEQMPLRATAGKEFFLTRCSLCHGKTGEGNGRMARMLTTPPPADLTASRLPDSYLQQIISGGGEVVGRSPKMPPWGDQFSKSEIRAIIKYIKSIRD